MTSTVSIRLRINGKPYGPVDVPDTISMIEVLHEYFNLTGTRFGCGVAQCRACTVIVDEPDGSSEASLTCVLPASFFDGKSIRTIEGHAVTNAQGELVLSPVQQAFLEGFSFQCGYCTPGFVNKATVLVENLKRNPVPAKDVETRIAAELNDHLCRCTGYRDYCTALRDLILRSPGLTT